MYYVVTVFIDRLSQLTDTDLGWPSPETGLYPELRFTKNLPKGRYLGNSPNVVINQVIVILETAHTENMGNIIQAPPYGHIYNL